MALNSAQVRAEVGHPVIDADGHLQEFTTCLRDDVIEQAREIGGPALVRRVEQTGLTFDEEMIRNWSSLDDDQRRDRWAPCRAWWAMPTRADDRAAAHLPGLLYERLDSLGIDYCVLYPSTALSLSSVADDEVRRLACRVYNTTVAEMYGPYADRMTPVAVIPMGTPEEAIDELDHAIVDLGLKSIVISNFRRPITEVARTHPEAASFARRLDTFGIDSDHDYDPFWRRCVELRVAVGVHASEQGFGSRTSPSRYVYNHLGGFAAGCESMCKSIFLGGVTRRFPSLRFAFLEGGVGWAVSLLSDLVGHWEKRNIEALSTLDPSVLDLDQVQDLISRYGPEQITRRIDRAMDYFHGPQWRPTNLDDWRSCDIHTVQDIEDLFVVPFFFGCEGDDPLNVLAFNRELNPFGAHLQAIFGSDIGHWDVPDMTKVVSEAYEPVERGLLSAEEFRDLMFTNPVKLYTHANPDFFDGTVCETSARAVKAPM